MSPETVMGVRLVIQVATILLLARYHEPQARFRLGPSMLAGTCMVISAMLTVPIVLAWDEEARRNTQFLMFAVALIVFLPTAWARGDMAKVYDKITRRQSKSPQSK